MKFLKSSIKGFYRKFNFDIIKSHHNTKNLELPLNTLQEILLQFKAFGFSPSEIYDIGANRGNWTRSVLRIFPDAAYLLIEPQLHLRGDVIDLLANPKVEIINCALSNRVGKARFSLDSWDVTNHLISEDGSMDSRDTDQFLEVDVMTVGDLIELRGRVPDIIKIDAEGFDLQVLEGANKAFGATEMFLVEAALCCQSMQNDVRTVVNLMDKAGYRLTGMTDINTYQWPTQGHSPGLQWLVDLVFLRKDSIILTAFRQPNREKSRIVSW